MVALFTEYDKVSPASRCTPSVDTLRRMCSLTAAYTCWARKLSWSSHRTASLLVVVQVLSSATSDRGWLPAVPQPPFRCAAMAIRDDSKFPTRAHTFP